MGIKPDSKKPGTYVVSYSKRHPITRDSVSLRRIGFRSIAEAKREYEKMIVEVERKCQQALIPTWSTLLSEFADHQLASGLTTKTIENYGLCLRAHTLEAWGEHLLTEITPHDIRTLINERVGKRSIAHQQNLVKFIKGAFQCAVEKGYLKTNPTPTFRLRIPDRVKLVLTEEQVRLLLNKAREFGSEWYAHWTVAVYTGLRNGELYALTWGKVNFETRQITVDRAWNSMDGFKSTKSGHERILPVNDSFLSVLRELKLAGEGGEYVLPRSNKWNKGEQARELRQFLSLIGLPPIRFHDLRATWATMLLSKGVPPVQVMKMGGWRDMKTMMIYTRMAGIDVRGATDCLDFQIRSQPAQILEFQRSE